jgi:hypothetical protein
LSLKVKHLLTLAGSMLIVSGIGWIMTGIYSEQARCEVYRAAYVDHTENCWSGQAILGSLVSQLYFIIPPILAGSVLLPYAIIRGHGIEVTGLLSSGVPMLGYAALLVLAAAHLFILFMGWGSNQYFIETRGCTDTYLESIQAENLKEQQEFCSVVIPVYNLGAIQMYVNLTLSLAWIIPLCLAIHKGGRVPGFLQLDKGNE